MKEQQTPNHQDLQGQDSTGVDRGARYIVSFAQAFIRHHNLPTVPSTKLPPSRSALRVVFLWGVDTNKRLGVLFKRPIDGIARQT